jgi:hypothetical protein
MALPDPGHDAVMLTTPANTALTQRMIYGLRLSTITTDSLMDLEVVTRMAAVMAPGPVLRIIVVMISVDMM